MREAFFIRNNKEKWEQFESLLGQKNVDADVLSDLYVKTTDDLAFAQTHYPNSRSHRFLNSLAARIHQSIYRNKKEKTNRFFEFWKYELPALMGRQQGKLLISLLVFGISVCIGFLSVTQDDTFARLILGDNYVNMTLANIEKGDPMAVYKSYSSNLMFLGITINNIKVSFLAFVLGIFISLGTGFILLKNGIMLGAFQGFFYNKQLLWDSFSTIWIHGTLEISAIIIAGAAGIRLGNSILFPGTYPRMYSFRKGAKEGLKMVIGLIPIFIAAGFLESYVTRISSLPDVIKLTIIILSASFIIYYFVIYPHKITKHGKSTNRIT